MRTPRARVILLTAALALLVFLLVPASIYLGNLPEFRIAAAPLARLLLVPALLLLVLVMLGLGFTRHRDHNLLCTLLAALILLAWIQSYLLVWDYGPLDGESIDWSVRAWRGVLDLTLWIAGLSLAVKFHRRLGGVLVTAALAIVAMQAVAVTATGLARRESLAPLSAQAGTPAAMSRFSPERNVLHIVLDSFQADVFQDLVTGPDGEALRAALPGFTFFEEHLGTFPATWLAMPVIVSGQVYLNREPQKGFMEAAYSRGSILHAAREAGFEVDIAADAWLLDLLSKGGVDNTYEPGGMPPAHDAARLLDLALFRLVPHWVKPAVYNGQRWLVQRLLGGADLQRFTYFLHNAFLSQVARTLTADRDKPVYKFFHLMTTHRPFVVKPDCSAAGEVVPRVRTTVTVQSRCAMAYVAALFDSMKRAGVYDRSLIVLMGDHGGHIDPYRYQPGQINSGGKITELRPHEVAMATPLLAIKPPGDTAPFRVSPAFTSMTDVPATVNALMQFGGEFPGRSIWDGGAPPAERRYYIYHWRVTDPDSDYVKWIEEFEITGSVYQAQSWHPVAAYLPPKP